MRLIIGIALLAALGGVYSKPFSQFKPPPFISSPFIPSPPFVPFPFPSNVEIQQNANPLSAIFRIASCVLSKLTGSGSGITFNRIGPAIMQCALTSTTGTPLSSEEKAVIEEAMNDLLKEEIVQELEEQQVAEVEDNSQEEVPKQLNNFINSLLRGAGSSILRDVANNIG